MPRFDAEREWFITAGDVKLSTPETSLEPHCSFISILRRLGVDGVGNGFALN